MPDYPVDRNEQRRLPGIDGLRGLACLMVVLFHYGSVPVIASPGSAFAYLKQALSLGWVGVDLFFVLSGFLLGGICIDQRESARFFKTFYVRRTLRIVPLYLAFFATLGVLAAWLPASLDWFTQSSLPLWPFLLYLQNFFMAAYHSLGPYWAGVTWSLSVEEQFYLILPALVWIVPASRLPSIIAIFILSAPVARFVVFLSSRDPHISSYVLLPCRWDALFLGVLGAWIMRQPHWRSRIIAHRPLMAAAVFVLAIPVVLSARERFRPYADPVRVVIFSDIGCLFLGLTLLAVVSPTIGRWLSFRPLVSLGRVSYGVYLMHLPVFYLGYAALFGGQATVAGGDDLLFAAFAFAVTVLLALISFRYLEAPLLRVGHRWRYEEIAELPVSRNPAAPVEQLAIG